MKTSSYESECEVSLLSWSNDVRAAIESILPVEAAAPCGHTDAVSIDIRGDVVTYFTLTCCNERVRNRDNPGRNLRAAVVGDEIADPMVLLV
jgi:hypothetical protein